MNSKSCNGDESKGYCSVGYVGAVCSACDNKGSVWGEKYGAVDSLNDKGMLCSKCSEIS